MPSRTINRPELLDIEAPAKVALMTSLRSVGPITPVARIEARVDVLLNVPRLRAVVKLLSRLLRLRACRVLVAERSIEEDDITLIQIGFEPK